MTLWDLKAKTSATVTSVSYSLSHEIISRLREMGIEGGQDIHCVRRGPFNGPVVMEVGGSIFALEKDLAQRISVQAHA